VLTVEMKPGLVVSDILFSMTMDDQIPVLDAKTDLLTGLLTGIQGWKCPVALSQTCYGSKSLKVILMDSNFGGHPKGDNRS
jgi:hypothetical protein